MYKSRHRAVPDYITHNRDPEKASRSPHFNMGMGTAVLWTGGRWASSSSSSSTGATPFRGHDHEATLANIVARALESPRDGEPHAAGRVGVASRQGPRRRAAHQGPRASPRPSSCTRFLAASTGRCSGALSPPTCRRRSACVTVRLAAAAVGVAMPVPTTVNTRRTCRTAVVPVIHCNCHGDERTRHFHYGSGLARGWARTGWA